MENKLGHFQCRGCGSQIQEIAPQQPGYLEHRNLINLISKQQPILCKRCFKLIHYKEVTPLTIQVNDFEKIISRIPSGVTIIAVTDIFDLSQDFFNWLKKFPDKNNFIIVINKIEDLPRDYKISAIQNWIRKTAKANKINLQYIVPVSAKTKYNIDLLYQILDQEVKKNKIYFVGNANVGKSSLINALIKSQNQNITEPAISALPGTTLNLLTFQNGDQTWVDTPGLVLKNQSLSFLKLSDWKLILPNRRIRPVTYQLDAGQSIFVGGFGWLDYLDGPKASFTFYFNEQVRLHRKKTNHDNQEFFVKHFGEILIPPKERSVDPCKIDIATKIENFSYKTDLVFSGLGWISITKGKKICLNFNKELTINRRDSLI